MSQDKSLQRNHTACARQIPAEAKQRHSMFSVQQLGSTDKHQWSIFNEQQQ
jgi:hypothetical protein